MPFTRDTLDFLAALEQNNNRDWFDPRKDDYKRLVRAPLLELAAEINRQLERFAPDYITAPEKSIFRIYRDIRFSKDKRPYKTNAALLFWHHAVPKNTGPAFYVSVSAAETMIAGGLYMPAPPEALAVREHIARRHEDLRAVLRARPLRSRFGDLRGESLSRPPRGFAPEHPAVDLLKRKDWVLWTTEPGSACLGSGFTKHVASGFRLLMPLVEFLNKPLLARAKRAQDPLAAAAGR